MSSGRMCFIRRLVVLIGESVFVFACVFFLLCLCGGVGEWIVGLIAGGYVYDEWFDSRAEWFTRVGAIVLVPFVVAFLTIAVGGRRWLTAVALALLPFAAVYIYFACIDEDFCLFFLPRFGWIVPAASLLLAAAGAALAMVVRRRCDKWVQSGGIAGDTRLYSRITSAFGNSWGPCGWVLFMGWLATWLTIHTGLPALIWVGLGFVLFLWWLTDVADQCMPIWRVLLGVSMLATAYVAPLRVKVFLIIAAWVLYWIVRKKLGDRERASPDCS